MSKTNIDCLEDWIYSLKLTTRAERKKAMNISNIDTIEYYKTLVEKKKHFYTAPPIKKIYTYE